MGHGYVDVPIPPACGVPPVTRRGMDATVETTTTVMRGVANYWAGAIADARTPLDIAMDGMRWWQGVAGPPPPPRGNAAQARPSPAPAPTAGLLGAVAGRRGADARAAAAGRARLVH